MATLEQIAEAIRRADAAGNAEDVMALGQAYRALQSQGNGAAATANANASAASQRLQGKVADLRRASQNVRTCSILRLPRSTGWPPLCRSCSLQPTPLAAGSRN